MATAAVTGKPVLDLSDLTTPRVDADAPHLPPCPKAPGQRCVGRRLPQRGRRKRDHVGSLRRRPPSFTTRVRPVKQTGTTTTPVESLATTAPRPIRGYRVRPFGLAPWSGTNLHGFHRPFQTALAPTARRRRQTPGGYLPDEIRGQRGDGCCRSDRWAPPLRAGGMMVTVRHRQGAAGDSGCRVTTCLDLLGSPGRTWGSPRQPGAGDAWALWAAHLPPPGHHRRYRVGGGSIVMGRRAPRGGRRLTSPPPCAGSASTGSYSRPSPATQPRMLGRVTCSHQGQMDTYPPQLPGRSARVRPLPGRSRGHPLPVGQVSQSPTRSSTTRARAHGAPAVR